MNATADRRTLVAGAVLFLVSASFVVLRTGRDALFLAGDGLFALPWAFMAQALVSVPQAMGVLWLMRRFGLRPVRMLAFACAAGVGLAYSILAQPGGSWPMTTLFFMLPLVFSIAFALAWLLGSELLSPLGRAASSRAFQRLGAASVLGGIAGSALSRLVGPALGSQALLPLGTVLMLGALPVAAHAHRVYPAAQPSSATLAGATPRGPPLAAVLRAPAVTPLLAVAVAGAMTGILVDFQFYLGAATGADDARVAYIANAYLCLSMGSLLLQLVVTPWLTRKAGMRAVLLVLPVSLTIGGAVALASASALVRAGLRAVEGGVKQGVHRAGWEQTLATFPESMRAKIKVVVDGMAVRLAEGIAAAVILGWMSFASEGRSSDLEIAWVAEVSAAWMNLGLVAVALAGVSLTLLLSRRLDALTGTRTEKANLDEPVHPAECCPVTAAEGERLLRIPGPGDSIRPDDFQADVVPSSSRERRRAPHPRHS